MTTHIAYDEPCRSWLKERELEMLREKTLGTLKYESVHMRLNANLD